MNYLIPSILFAIGGVFDGYRDFKKLEVIVPPFSIGLSNIIWFRIKFPRSGWLINIPIDRWHVAKTLSYACLALATWLSPNWWAMVIGWVIIRPPFQNSLQWSLIEKKFTLRLW